MLILIGPKFLVSFFKKVIILNKIFLLFGRWIYFEGLLYQMLHLLDKFLEDN